MCECNTIIQSYKVRNYLKNKKIFRGKFTEIRGCENHID